MLSAACLVSRYWARSLGSEPYLTRLARKKLATEKRSSLFQAAAVSDRWKTFYKIGTRFPASSILILLAEVKSRLSPFFFHLTSGSGWPLGGEHSRTMFSPRTASVSWGTDRNSSRRSDGKRRKNVWMGERLKRRNKSVFVGNHDIQQNDTQHNDTKHNDTQYNDTQHNNTQHNYIQYFGIQHNDN